MSKRKRALKRLKRLEKLLGHSEYRSTAVGVEITMKFVQVELQLAIQELKGDYE